MNIGKITVFALGTAMAAVGVNEAINASNNMKDRQQILESGRDIYQHVDKSQKKSAIALSIAFTEGMHLYENLTDKKINALLAEDSFSNTNIYAKTDLVNGVIRVHNCNKSDISNLKELLKIDKNQPYRVISKFENADVAFEEELFALQNNNTVEFYLDDIGNEDIVRKYKTLNNSMQRKLSDIFAGAEVNYDSKNSVYTIQPTGKNNVYEKEVLPFFNQGHSYADLNQFAKFNPWASTFFEHKFADPIKDTIEIPYALVTRTFVSPQKLTQVLDNNYTVQIK